MSLGEVEGRGTIISTLQTGRLSLLMKRKQWIQAGATGQHCTGASTPHSALCALTNGQMPIVSLSPSLGLQRESREGGREKGRGSLPAGIQLCHILAISKWPPCLGLSLFCCRVGWSEQLRKPQKHAKPAFLVYCHSPLG